MFAYITRRAAYGALVVLGVLLFLFVLFFAVAKPDDIARKALGDKVSAQVIEQWKANHGYNKPLWPSLHHLRDNLLVEHYTRMLTFDFGRSDADDSVILDRIGKGLVPSLSLTVPMLLIGLGLAVLLSLLVAFFRETYLDRAGVLLAVLSMSISVLLYIITVQFILGKLLRWFPISGFDPSPEVAWRFLAMPILVGVIAHLGSDIRFYRTVFLEEIHRDYVRTARAKGCGEGRIMLLHVLRNALIPLVSKVAVEQIPYLFMGALLLEGFFGIPGLGSMLYDAIDGNDFSVLRTMVYILSLVFVISQILADICYTLVDPRVRLE
jgi:peptide/nickel transport system permease protein